MLAHGSRHSLFTALAPAEAGIIFILKNNFRTNEQLWLTIRKIFKNNQPQPEI